MVSARRQREELPTPSEPVLPPVVWVSPEEAKRQFDELARSLLGMSGDEFIRRMDAGEFLDLPDDLEHRAYAELSVLSAIGR
jgi:hypothetical protein